MFSELWHKRHEEWNILDAADPKSFFIYINHLYVSTGIFLIITTVYTQPITKEGGATLDNTRKTKKNEMRPCFRGRRQARGPQPVPTCSHALFPFLL